MLSLNMFVVVVCFFLDFVFILKFVCFVFVFYVFFLKFVIINLFVFNWSKLFTNTFLRLHLHLCMYVLHIQLYSKCVCGLFVCMCTQKLKQTICYQNYLSICFVCFSFRCKVENKTKRNANKCTIYAYYTYIYAYIHTYTHTVYVYSNII